MHDLSAKVRPKLAVIDYGMGNLRSVLKAWDHVGASASLVHDPQELVGFDALIFPGQGAIVDAMRLLKKRGFDAAIRDWVSTDKPFFGICLGLQALFEHSEEGDTEGLGILKGTVKRFKINPTLKIPHMGWNTVHFDSDEPITAGLLSGQDQFYFVHSYYIEPSDRSLVLFESHYGGKFVSGILSGNLYATQFHPEISQAKGLQLYRNFLKSI